MQESDDVDEALGDINGFEPSLSEKTRYPEQDGNFGPKTVYILCILCITIGIVVVFSIQNRVCLELDKLPFMQCTGPGTRLEQDRLRYDNELLQANLLNVQAQNAILTLQSETQKDIINITQDSLNNAMSAFWECNGYDVEYIKQHPNQQAKTEIERALSDLNKALSLYNKTK